MHYTDKNVKPIFLKEIGIPDISVPEQQPLITLVEKILAIKKSDATASTTALETEIDKLVYSLYGLTQEEIKIVEGSK